MSLAIFDLDDTLLAGDSDYLWGRFLVQEGVVDGEHHERENERFFRQYQEGNLDIHEWLHFQLRPLADNEPERMHALRARFIDECIRPIVPRAARELVARHRDAGDTLLIITSTNAFITRPIATLFGIDELLASEPEVEGGRYTGAVSGTPSFREGKITRLYEWLGQRGIARETLAESWFYSDSHNDLPLLELVGHPVAVDPDPTLARLAESRAWQVISLR